MSNKGNIDKIFRDRLHDLETAVPDRVWERIAVVQESDSKRRFGFNRLAGLSALFILALLTAFFIGRQFERQSGVDLNDDEISLLKDDKESVGSSDNNILPKTSLIEKASNVIELNTKSTSTDGSFIDNTNKNKIALNESAEFLSENKSIENFAKPVSNLNTFLIKKSTNSTFTHTPITENISATKSTLTTDNQSSNESLSILMDSEHDRYSDEITSSGLINSFGRIIGKTFYSDLLIPEQLITSDELFKIRLRKSRDKNKGDCPSFREVFGGRWYGDIVAGYEFAQRDLSAKNSSAQTLTNQRAASESTKEAFEIGARISYLFLNGVALRSGAIYSQINEEFRIQNGERTETKYIEFRDNNGEVKLDTLIQVTPIFEVGTNNYRMIDVPLYVGYEYHFDKLVLLANAGVHFNALLSTSGKIIQDGDTIVGLSSDQSPFSDRYGISYYGSLGVGYKINPTTQVLFEPYFKRLPSLTQESYNLDQSYNIFGLSAGLRFKF